MSGLEMAAAGAMGAQAAGTLLGGYGEYRSGMAQAAEINASRPYDLINAANRATGLKYSADTALAGGQRQAQAQTTEKNLLLSRSRAVAAAGGGGANDTTVVNQEALIEQLGAFDKAMTLFPAQEEFNQLNYESGNALLEGVNTYNAKGVAASRARSASKLQAVGTLLSSAGAGVNRLGKTTFGQKLFGGPTDIEVLASEARLKGAEAYAESAHRALLREDEERRRGRRALWSLGRRRYSSIYDYDWED